MTADLEPIYVSVKQAAQLLALKPPTVYTLLDQQAMESRYFGSRRRLVVLASLREYAASLPSAPPQSAAS